MSSVDYQEQIPNNVNLSDNRRLQRALESWQPAFLDWWKDMGPDGTYSTADLWVLQYDPSQKPQKSRALRQCRGTKAGQPPAAKMRSVSPGPVRTTRE